MNDYRNDNDNRADEAAARKRALDEPFAGFEEPPRYPGTSAPVYDSSSLSMTGLPAEDSQFTELLKGILGAVVGAIPGFVLWILIGRLGIIAAVCGALLAGGAVWGYIFMTKDGLLDEKYCLIVCIAVCLIAIYFAQRIIYCWVLSDAFDQFRKALVESAAAFGEVGGYTHEQVETKVDRLILDEFGFTEGSFSNFFSNFGKVKKALGMGGRFYFRLVEGYAFGFLGGFGIFKKSNI